MSSKKNIRLYSTIKTFKVIDYVLQNAVVIVMIHAVAYVGAYVVNNKDYLAQTLVIIFLGFLVIRFWQFSKKDESGITEIRFEGDIDQLIVKMVAACGLQLKGKIGDYYTFASYNKFLPNVEYTVRDCGEHCVVIACGSQFHNNVDRLLGLQPSHNEVR